MPASQFIHDGDTIDYTPVSATPAGTVVVQGGLIGITKRGLAANELGALAVTGVFDLPKVVGGSTAIAVGTELFWDFTTDTVTDNSAGDVFNSLGRCVAPATDEDLTVRVRLSQ